MKQRFHKILTLTFSLVLAASIMTPAFAAENDAIQMSPVKLTAQPIVFNVTVPSGLPVDVDSKGEVTVATNVQIENHSAAPITITGVQVNPITDWNIVAINKDFHGTRIGTKEFGFILNSDEVSTNGTVSLTKVNWPSINGGSSLSLVYDSVVAPQRDAITGNKIADVIFTIGWDAVEAETPTEPEIKYVLATDADFSGTIDGTFKYIGTDEYVEIPHVIKGVPVTSYSGMFSYTLVQGVKSTNSNVTNMSNMFAYSQATVLDLSGFDTSNVTNMMSMFNGSKATTLDLSSFNTSKVTNMKGMFTYSEATVLDLSSFDTSNVTNMMSMFNESQATTLDLSSFDTSKVTNMNNMFSYSEATVLDLSSFDTSKVTNMEGMFSYSEATVLDLSSFNTYNVTNMEYMFYVSRATTGYARIQEEANKFNATYMKPDTLTFRIK